MLSKLVRLLASAITTISLSRHAWATPIVSNPSSIRVSETHDDFSHHGINFQQPLANPELIFLVNNMVINIDFTYTFEKKNYPIKNLPVWLTYQHPLRGQKRIKTVTNNDGNAKFEDDKWPADGVEYDITVILDGRLVNSPYIIVSNDDDPDKAIRYVRNYPKQLPAILNMKLDIDDTTYPNVASLRLSEVLRNLAAKTEQLGLPVELITVVFPDTKNMYGAFGLDKNNRPTMWVGGSATRLVVAHEWGHYFTYLAQQKHYIYYGGGKDDGHNPCAKNPQDPQVAFGEGFASAYALIMENAEDGILVDGPNPTNYELYSCGNPKNMSTDEGWFTAALFDLWDSNNDSNGNDPNRGAMGHADSNKNLELTPQEILLDPIRNALTKPEPNKYILSPKSYWNNLEEVLNKKKGSDSKWEERLEKAKEIFRYNYATFV